MKKLISIVDQMRNRLKNYLMVHDRGGGGLVGFPIVRLLKRHIYFDGQQAGYGVVIQQDWP